MWNLYISESKYFRYIFFRKQLDILSFFLSDIPSNRKKAKIGKIENSGTKPVILKNYRCTTYCQHLATSGEITQQES